MKRSEGLAQIGSHTKVQLSEFMDLVQKKDLEIHPFIPFHVLLFEHYSERSEASASAELLPSLSVMQEQAHKISFILARSTVKELEDFACPFHTDPKDQPD